MVELFGTVSVTFLTEADPTVAVPIFVVTEMFHVPDVADGILLANE